ncbi:MAG: hypothetical protein ABIY50_02285 [Ignavibacteria bacterium]
MNPFNIFKYLPFFLRKKFDEKYIIIESDDWGLERALSVESIEWMKKKFGENKFSRWTLDSLETSDDITGIYDVLEKYTGKFENPPVLTANFITHNVDYSSKEILKMIPVSKGFNENSEDVRWLYKIGIAKNYIYPQLHGYSHYNLNELKDYFLTEEGIEAFNNNFLGGRSTIKGNMSFLQGELSLKNTNASNLKEATMVFSDLFGFYPKTIIPPTFIFDIQHLKILRDNGITLIQSSNRLITTDKKRFNFPYFQKRKGLYWSIRNSRLDPNPEYNFYHEQCINSIEKAFENRSPAIIDFHRVNFAGKFNPDYKQTTLKELKLLLDKIYEKWPEAKFIHTQTLNDMLWQQETK